jgi:hypothetical protein
MSGHSDVALSTQQRIRTAVALYLFGASCIAVIGVPQIMSGAIDASSIELPSMQGRQIPAFTQVVLPVLAQATPIFFAVLAVSVLLAVVAWRRVQAWDVRLFWIGVLSSFNFFLAFFALVVALSGFFILPALANAP